MQRTAKKLAERDAKRDLGAELLQDIRDIKRGLCKSFASMDDALKYLARSRRTSRVQSE